MKYLGAITSDYDLVNKKYVDDSIPTVPTITLNGGTTSSPNFYAPVGAGTSGQYLEARGSGTPPVWVSFPTIPSITLNGSSTTSPSFYAPTSVGTSGYVLQSNGSGAPSWTSAALTDTKVSTAAVTSGSNYYPVFGSDTTSAATKYYDSTGSVYQATTSTPTGYARLRLGNTTASGTSGAKYGVLRLCQTGTSKYSDLVATDSDANITSNLPARSGTLENGFVSVSSVSSFSATNNTFTAARNGIFIFNMRASAASAYIGIQDTHDSVYMAQQTIPNNGNYASVCFPVLSGRQYKIIQATNLTSTSAYVIYFG